MKNFIYISLLVLLLFPAVSGQAAPYANLGKMTQSINKMTEKQIRAAVAQGVSLEQTRQAREALAALQKAYPEYENLIKDTARAHEQLAAAAFNKTQPDEIFYWSLKSRLENLYRVFIQFPKEHELTGQVTKILNHLYWLDDGRRALSLAQLQDKIYETFSPSSSYGAKYEGLQIEGSGWIATLKAD